MTLGDTGDFVPRFPVYIPCRVIDGESQILFIGMSDSSGREVQPCIALFTDKQHCVIFGAAVGFPNWVVKASARSLADFLLEMSQRNAGSVLLDPPTPDEVRGGVSIDHAIQFLWRLADPPEEV